MRSFLPRLILIVLIAAPIVVGAWWFHSTGPQEVVANVNVPYRETQTTMKATEPPVQTPRATVVFDPRFQPCQGLGPAAPYCVWGIDGANTDGCGELNWLQDRAMFWQSYAQGEYVGHYRTRHVGVYRLRVDDLMEMVFRNTRIETTKPYEFNVGDEVRVESFTDPSLNRDLVVQPDGTITVRLLGQVRAAHKTVTGLRDEIEERYRKFYPDPAISVIPLKVNTKLLDILATVDSRYGFTGGQGRQAKVTPDGTIALPAIGSVPAQGMTLDELKTEVDQRYAQIVEGIEVTPVLIERAPRYVYVLGEVAEPGRFVLEGPTTAMQAIALAGGWTVGGNLRQIVVFRRGNDWRLMATKLDLRGALLGKRPTPSDEIWLNDSDIVVVPKMPILVIDEAIDLVFQRGIYGVLPMQGISLNFAKLGSL